MGRYASAKVTKLTHSLSNNVNFVIFEGPRRPLETLTQALAALRLSSSAPRNSSVVR